MEFIATCVYASTLSEDKKRDLIKEEYIFHPKYQEKLINKRNS